MSACILYDRYANRSAMYCDTDGRAFGPVFDGNDATDFLEWMLARGRDPRGMNDNTLDIWVAAWQDEHENREPTDVSIYGAGVK